MPDWLDKAKDAAKQAAEKAKTLAETAKNADYGAMVQKTKDAASHAAEEAKRAADNIMKKEQPPTQADIVMPPDNPQADQQATAAPTANVVQPSVAAQPAINKEQVLAKIAQVDHLLQEIKALLK